MVIKFVKPDKTSLIVGDNYEWRLQKNGLEGFSSFEAKLTTSSDYARDGGTVDAIRLDDKKRVIKICNIDWRNSGQKREQARSFFNYGVTYRIYITVDDETRWGEAILYRMAMNEPTNEDYMLKLTMSFEFENPYLLSVDDFGKDIAELTPNFGFPYISRMIYGTTPGVFNFSRTVTLSNDGDNIAYPKINMKFRNEVTNPKVIINDGFIRFIGVFDTTDNILIDYTVNPPRVTNNDNNILGLCDRESAFDDMYIQVGDNTISFDADNGTDEMSVSVYYNKMYTVI